MCNLAASMALERDIHDLLHFHDCVIVPRLGGFITHHRPARVDEQRHLVHPPAKDISFNRHLVRNDGLLADRLGRRHGVDFPTADRMIADEVHEWRARIHSEGRLELERVGVLFLDAEKNLQFEPDRHANLLRDAFGLRPLPAVPVAAVTPVVPLSAGPVQAEERRSAWMWAAAAMGTLLVGTAIWYMVFRGPLGDGVEWGAFGPWKEEPVSYAPRRTASVAIDDQGPAPVLQIDGRSGSVTDILLDEGGPVLHVAPVVAVDSTSVAMPVLPETLLRGRYHVIGGCFSDPMNAERLVNELRAQGFAAHVLDEHQGLHRVAYGSFPQRAAALEALQAVRRSSTPKAWLLIK